MTKYAILPLAAAEVANVYQAMGCGWVDIASSIAPKPQNSVAPRL